MSDNTDLHVQWAKLETEFLQLNLAADQGLQQQLDSARVGFDCNIALIVSQCQQRGSNRRNEATASERPTFVGRAAAIGASSLLPKLLAALRTMRYLLRTETMSIFAISA